MRWVAGDLVDALLREPAASCDFLALSNVVELAPKSFADRLRAALARAAAPGAIAVLRSILPAPPLDLRAAGLELDEAASARLTALDRSGVCADVRVYRRR